MFEQVLKTGDPSIFRTQRLRIQIHASHDQIVPLIPKLNFQEMTAYRVPQPYEYFVEQPDFIVANLGVSAYIIARFQQQDYLLCSRIKLPDRNYLIAKLLSGYIPSEQLYAPWTTMCHELCEELLMWVGDGLWQPEQAGGAFYQPYVTHIPYTGNYRFTHIAPQFFPIAERRPIKIGGVVLPHQPNLYFYPHTASAQLVYYLKIDFDQVLTKQQQGNLSLYYADEALNRNTKLLETIPEQRSLWLIPMVQGGLLPELYCLIEGMLIPQSIEQVHLTGYFSLDSNRVVTYANRSLANIADWQLGK